ncbi:site-specific integrase [Rhodoferax sp. WC2427]|uniref:site-specific integrase n=1 Tax=Rhodoferax sp. WC2427 TaxID=3234144 RepID=UPI0034663573
MQKSLKLSLRNSGATLSEIDPWCLSPQSIAEPLSADVNCIQRFITAAISPNTRRAYQQDLQDFLNWGGTIPCTAEILAAYVAGRASSLATATITRRVVGIGRAHTTQGFSDPSKADLVRTVLRGVRRVNGTAQRQVAPLIKQDVMDILPSLKNLRGSRDRALILLGYASALRRSELVALQVIDLENVREGLVIHLRRSKTDQEGQGRKIAIPWGRTSACPVKAVHTWLASAAIEIGPIFRAVGKSNKVSDAALSPQSIALILKGHAQKIGLDSTQISGHSLRSGLVTSAVQAGVSVHKIQQQTGHRSLDMLARYVRDANLFEGNASGALL